MRSCHNCRNQHICKIYEEMNQSVMNGLKTLALSTTEENTKHSKSSWMQIFRTVASCCTKDQTSEQTDKFNSEIIKYSKTLAKELKNNKTFVKDFLNAYSEEARYRLVDKHLDDIYEDIIEVLGKVLNSPEEAVDIYELFEHSVMENLGV